MESSSGAVKTAFDIQVGRSKMTQMQLAESGSSHDRHTGRADMRSAIPAAASFLEGDVDVAPEPAR